MTVWHLKAVVTEDGQLQVELPDNLPPGEVYLTLESAPPPVEAAMTPLEALPINDDPITDEEWERLMSFQPATGAQIVQMMRETGGESA